MPLGSKEFSSNNYQNLTIRPLLSIVICTFNREELLQGCLLELLRQMRDIFSETLDILVVDNNSNDGTAAICSNLVTLYPSLRYVFEPTQGLSHARNRGAIESRGDYIVYLDDDALPGPNYLQKIIDMLSQKSPDIGGGPVYPFYTSKKPFWFQDQLEVRRHVRETGFFDCPISGGNFIISRRILFGLGMFSADFGMLGQKMRLGEERNLIERYRAATPKLERKIYYSQDCYIYHHVPAEKMKIIYFVRRAFESGRFKAQLAKEVETRSTDDMRPTIGWLEKIQKIVREDSGVYFPIRVLHKIAMFAGMTFFSVNNLFRQSAKFSNLNED